MTAWAGPGRAGLGWAGLGSSWILVPSTACRASAGLYSGVHELARRASDHIMHAYFGGRHVWLDKRA